MNTTIGSIHNIFNVNKISTTNRNLSFCGKLKPDVFTKSAEKAKNVKVDTEDLRAYIPEYLYHLTNNKAYETIKKEGVLKASKDMIDGVFMFDIQDFIKNWTKPCGKSNIEISHDIFKQALKSGDGFVLLKIPTKNLDTKKIVIRSEDEVLDFVGSTHYRNLALVYAEKGGILRNKQELPKYMTKGYSPAKAAEYNSQGMPVEYIYKDNIAIRSIDNINAGEFKCNSDSLYKTSHEDFSSMLDSLIFSQRS